MSGTLSGVIPHNAVCVWLNEFHGVYTIHRHYTILAWSRSRAKNFHFNIIYSSYSIGFHEIFIFLCVYYVGNCQSGYCNFGSYASDGLIKSKFKTNYVGGRFSGNSDVPNIFKSQVLYDFYQNK